MSTIIEKRISALEAKLPTRDTEDDKRFAECLRATWDFAETGKGQFGREPTTFALVTALLNRLDNGTCTAAEVETLAGLPKCHVPPHELLKLIAAFTNPVRSPELTERLRRAENAVALQTR